MTITVPEAMMEAIDVRRLTGHLEWFAKVRRDTGGPGEDRAADYIATELDADGVPVIVHEFPAYLSYPIRATLEVISPAAGQVRCLTHSFGRSTGAEGVTVDLVTVRDGMMAEARGRCPVVTGIATPVTVLEASRAGCAAIVFKNQGDVIHNMIATTIWGTPALDQVDRLPQLPVVSINRETGEGLERLLREAGTVRARIVTEVETGWYQSKLPEVRIPGTHEADFCLVGGHYCAWDVGITDNATGNASMLELARIFWANRGRLRRGIRCCWWPGHSHGRYSGSTWYADTFFTDLAEHCLAYHNIDSPGVKGATWYIARHTTAELERYCQSVIEQVTGQANAPVHRPSRAADQSFLASGVPSFSTYPFLPEDHSDRRPWTGGSANAWWWHSEHDTLDKADLSILALDTRISLTAVFGLVSSPLLPLDYVRSAEEIAGFLSDLRSRSGGHFDLAPIALEVERFLAAAQALETSRAMSAESPRRTAALNRLLIRLGRIVNPIVYSQGGRFTHDPAEWSPIMRATRIHTMSSLAKAALLPARAGSPEYGFLKTQVRREANRVITALREATGTIEEVLTNLGPEVHT